MIYDRFLTVQEASLHPTRLGMPAIAVGTLNKWRVTGDGPPFMRFGRRIVYPQGPYEDWMWKLLSKQVRSTSEFRVAVSASESQRQPT